jgi:hypothetical protein
MKRLFLLLTISFVVLATSCKKQNIEPNYTTIEDPADTLDTYQNYYGNQTDDYTDGGTLPTLTEDTSLLAGSKWVLIKYVSAFATEYPNDTIDFVDETHYTINGGAESNYILADVPATTNYDLTFYYFFPFGGSHYSAQVSEMIMIDGELNNVEFEDTQNSSTTIRAWFVKI